MPIQIRVMSWNIQEKQTNYDYVAETMQLHNIDIAALLEVPNGSAVAITGGIVASLNNLATAYHQNEWSSHFVDVGDEAVGYIWHQTNNVGQNAFTADLMQNGVAQVAGKVLRNGANNRIYFPKTQSNWGSLPGTPDGRRPGYMAFVTNDGNAVRRFTVLDLHAPFDKIHSIQSYSTSLYATSREITQVGRVDVAAVATAASGVVSAAMSLIVDPYLVGLNYITPLTFRNAAVTGALAEIVRLSEEIDLAILFHAAALRGATSALDGAAMPAKIDIDDDGKNIAKACAAAGIGAAASLIAAVQLPTAPPAAIANVAAARGAAMGAVTGQVSQFQSPTKKGAAVVRSAVELEASRMVAAAVAPFTFAALPLTQVDAAIIAGDFNVVYPDDQIDYQPANRTVMGGQNYNAYSRLLLIDGQARNRQKSTRKLPGGYNKIYLYELEIPCPVQSVNALLNDYVPLDLTTLVLAPTNYVGYDVWNDAIKQLAFAQNRTWASIWGNATYNARLTAAFDQEIIDDTSYYRANCYDNIFVRGAAVNTSGLIDVMSELGSWPARAAAVVNPQPGLPVNPWVGAVGRLNGLAQQQLGLLGAQLQFTYDGNTYNITAPLATAQEAAIFFHEYIADHLPVFVEVAL